MYLDKTQMPQGDVDYTWRDQGNIYRPVHPRWIHAYLRFADSDQYDIRVIKLTLPLNLIIILRDNISNTINYDE